MGATAPRPAGLERGTLVRSRRAALKRLIGDGEVDVVQLLEGELPGHEETALQMKIEQLLEAVPGVGSVTSGELCKRAEIAPDARLSALTIARRRLLADELGKETDA